ncbi:MAG: glutamate dehydrogenase [Desulfobacterales bacterium SG8_35_2]|jgi:glutamate dehydrogenase (NAD(P)+)|nr:MAG: glutamate dehydrogenase [Desulfobacterales bacterium SG8_35_2]
MKDVFSYADDLGPAKIIHVYEPSVNLKAVLVVDNVAKGPSIGGIRMAEDVSTEECVRLARAMTFKNAAAGLPHGGGKIVVYGDPKMDKKQKQKILRGLASSLRNEEDYIFAPDMGTDEECMAWIKDEVGRVVGLPREVGGIPLDEIGATGWGLSHVTDVALNFCDFDIKGARVVIQGFGAVGKNCALFLRDQGAVLVATADTQGIVYNADGLDVDALVKLKEQGKSVIEYSDAKKMNGEALIDIECDIWIPAARPDVIHDDNVGRLKTRLVVEGANIPITHSAETTLHKRGILCIPDFIANAGGVICAAMEYRGSNKTAVFQSIEEKLRRNTQMVLDRMKNENILPRQAAVELATERVRKAMSYRRFSLFSTAPGFI